MGDVEDAQMALKSESGAESSFFGACRAKLDQVVALISAVFDLFSAKLQCSLCLPSIDAETAPEIAEC
jgi:hypothetical protein